MQGREYFSLGGCCGPERPIYTSIYNNREYLTLGGCVGTGRQRYEQATITENISLWEGVVVLKGQYIRASCNNREYFTLGGCCGIRASYNDRNIGLEGQGY